MNSPVRHCLDFSWIIIQIENTSTHLHEAARFLAKPLSKQFPRSEYRRVKQRNVWGKSYPAPVDVTGIGTKRQCLSSSSIKGGVEEILCTLAYRNGRGPMNIRNV